MFKNSSVMRNLLEFYKSMWVLQETNQDRTNSLFGLAVVLVLVLVLVVVVVFVHV